MFAKQPVIVLRTSEALLGCEAEIAISLGVVLRHAHAMFAANPVVELRTSAALLGCEAASEQPRRRPTVRPLRVCS
jgi:hypothetical protein